MSYNDAYQLPEEPPPPELPPPPEKPLELLEELQPPPELEPDDNMNPPILARPLVLRSFCAFLYHLLRLRMIFAMGNATRYVPSKTRAPVTPTTIMGNIAQKGIKKR
jgi:hypothetical protein